MLKAVLDSTVLVSAFLSKIGGSGELLRQAHLRTFFPCISEEMAEETERVLLRHPKARKHYGYTDEGVRIYIAELRVVCQVITPTIHLQGVVRDPNDDMIVTCAVESQAQHIISRDKDLLSLGRYEGIEIVSPEDYMAILRRGD